MLAESVKLVDREFFFFLLFFLHLTKDNLLFTVNISFFKNASFNTLKAKFTLTFIVGYKILNERKERGKKVPNVNFLLKLEYFDETPNMTVKCTVINIYTINQSLLCFDQKI